MVISSEQWTRRGEPIVDGVVYPESDGQPMAENTKQYKWIVLLAENLDAALDCFVAADLLWYPVKGHPEIRVAPDVLVVLGRTKGHRGCYLQFREDGIPPTVVFEVLSPSNSMREMARKAAFYQAHGVSELIVIDPENESGWALVRNDADVFQVIEDLAGWTSPTLKIRFAREDGALVVYHPNGDRFLSFDEVQALLDEERARADEERARADEERARADAALARAKRLADKLAALGLDPDTI